MYTVVVLFLWCTGGAAVRNDEMQSVGTVERGRNRRVGGGWVDNVGVAL